MITSISFLILLLFWSLRLLCEFLWILTSTADSAVVDPYGIKTLLANDWSTFSIDGKPVYSNVPRSLSINSRDCIIFHVWGFDNFILAKKLFVEILQRFPFCLLVSNNLCRKIAPVIVKVTVTYSYSSFIFLCWF